MIATRDTPVPFEAYSGEGPYAFVSYAHADKPIVYKCMKWLRTNGIHMWYDEGIPPAGEWVEEIATAIKGSRLFLVFISPHAVDSRYVRSEVGYALSLDKDILSVYLKETDLPAGLDLCLQPFQSIRTQEAGWEDKAKVAILDSFGSADRSKLAFRAPTTTVAEFDESEPDLWESWDAARKAQRRRAKRRKEKVDKLPKSDEVPAPTKPKVSQPAEAGSPPKLPKSVASARVSRKTSNTRVPIALASQVIDETEAVSTRPEPHQDVLGAEYSWIPEGTLTVWVPYANECRMVEVREGFWLGRMLVTQDDYTNVMGVNPSHVENRQDLFSQEKLPVNNVSWLDAVSYGKAMTNLAKRHGILPKGYEFRLPAEVEWEYACRAGTATDYYFGDDPSELSNHAWFRGNSDKQIHPVGQKQPNPWGLYDMYGNIREWVGNSFVNTLLGDSEQDEFRISRGGGYMKTAAECQSSSRSTNSLYHRFRNLGFRMALAKTPQPVKV